MWQRLLEFVGDLFFLADHAGHTRISRRRGTDDFNDWHVRLRCSWKMHDCRTCHCAERGPDAVEILYQQVKFRRRAKSVKRANSASAISRSSHRDDEQPRKPQKHFAVEPRLIGDRDLVTVNGEEWLARLRIERRQVRLQGGAFEPFDDRLR